MSYTFYLGALASVVVAAISGGLFIALPMFGIYRLSTKFEGKCKWLVLILGDLCVIFSGGYLHTTVFCRYMDYVYMILGSMAS
jgi:hypothetical protein